MDTDKRKGLVEADLTFQIRSCVFGVDNELGPGFLEQVYEKALAISTLTVAGYTMNLWKPSLDVLRTAKSKYNPSVSGYLELLDYP